MYVCRSFQGLIALSWCDNVADQPKMWKIVLGTAAFTIPVSVTVFDLCGYVAKVEGSSMQVSASVWLYLLRIIPMEYWLSTDLVFVHGSICPLLPVNLAWICHPVILIKQKFDDDDEDGDDDDGGDGDNDDDNDDDLSICL